MHHTVITLVSGARTEKSDHTVHAYNVIKTFCVHMRHRPGGPITFIQCGAKVNATAYIVA